jgi:hypothetical protein
MSYTPPTLYCANHPDVETTLRCNRCEKPICPKCAVATPTGYRCRECVQGQQKIFETALWQDFLLGSLIAGGLAFIGSLVIPVLGFFSIILSPVAGAIIAELIRRITRKRRSRRLYQVIAVATLVGCLPLLLNDLIIFGISLAQGNIGSFLGLLWQFVYTSITTSTVYYRLSGIQINL